MGNQAIHIQIERRIQTHSVVIRSGDQRLWIGGSWVTLFQPAAVHLGPDLHSPSELFRPIRGPGTLPISRTLWRSWVTLGQVGVGGPGGAVRSPRPRTPTLTVIHSHRQAINQARRDTSRDQRKWGAVEVPCDEGHGLHPSFGVLGSPLA